MSSIIVKPDGFVINNGYIHYELGIDENRKLYHVGFLPCESAGEINLKNQKNRLPNPYPFEVLVNINYEPLQWQHGTRYSWTLSSIRSDYSGYKIIPILNGEKLVITLNDAFSGMNINLNYEIYRNSPAIRRYTSVENLSDKDIIVNHISSFVISNFPYFSQPEDSNDLYLHRFQSHWSHEGNHIEDSFDRLGLFKTFCKNGYTIENTSSWVCQKYIPYFVLEERDSRLFWAVQLETSGSWRFEAGAADQGMDNWFYLQGGMGNDLYAQWNKVLKPNEVFESIPCSMTSAKGKIQDIYNRMHEHQEKVLIKRSPTDKDFPVIYNDWQYVFGDVTHEKIVEQLDLIKDCGIDCYVIDAGWFTDIRDPEPRSGWWDVTGDWKYNSGRFPFGLEKIADEISSRGMIPGIWCEIEAAGKNSELYKTGNLLMKRGDFFVEDLNRRFLYFGNTEGREYADIVYEYLITCGFRYFKIDCNTDCAPGCTNSGESPGQGMHEHRLGYYLWLDNLREKHPDIIIENCSSGGMRLEYGMLSRTDLGSITDQEDNKQTGNILCQITKIIHPSQCGNWSTLKDTYNLQEFELTLINSMMGRMHISGNLLKQSDRMRDLINKAVCFYKNYRSILKNPTVIYHMSDIAYPENKGIIAYEYRSPDNSRAVLNVTRLDTNQNEININFEKLQSAEYNVCCFPSDKQFTINGDILCAQGLNVKFDSMYQAFIYYIFK